MKVTKTGICYLYVIELPCPCVCVCVCCPCHCKTPKGRFANFGLQSHNFTYFFSVDDYLRFQIFPFFKSHPSVDQPIADNGEARRGSYVAVVIIVSDQGKMTHET